MYGTRENVRSGRASMRPPMLISACLAGLRTRFDARSSPHPRLQDLVSHWLLVPVCPEILGGLGIPRLKCRFQDGDGKLVLQGSARVVNRMGVDCTSHFVRGAEEVKKTVEAVTPRCILFKEGSPSCGVRRVDIEGRKESGCGVTVAALRDLGIPIITEEDSLKDYLIH
jgi:uncharacterized protein YbbK (DUF523 family)